MIGSGSRPPPLQPLPLPLPAARAIGQQASQPRAACSNAAPSRAGPKAGWLAARKLGSRASLFTRAGITAAAAVATVDPLKVY